MQMPQPATLADSTEFLERQRLSIAPAVVLSADWQRILVARLEMYGSLRDTTVAKFGQARFDENDRAYAHFAGLFIDGKLGGTRVLARRKV